MKSKRRHFNSGILIHIYQRTRDGFLLFYNLTDFLVYYTIASIVAPRYGVQILAMCQMYDDKRTDLLFRINRELNIDIRQIAKYLRLKVESGH